jgi:pimeloyl-ACP methyl ester carboxylesterase
MKGQLFCYRSADRLIVVVKTDRTNKDVASAILDRYDNQKVDVHVLELTVDTGWYANRLDMQSEILAKLVGSIQKTEIEIKQNSDTTPHCVDLKDLQKAPATKARDTYVRIDFLCHDIGGLVARLAIAKSAKEKWIARIERFVLLGVPSTGLENLSFGPRYIGWLTMNFASYLLGDSAFPKSFGARPGSPFVIESRLLWMKMFKSGELKRIQIVMALGSQDKDLSVADIDDPCFGLTGSEVAFSYLPETSKSQYLKIADSKGKVLPARLNKLIDLIEQDKKTFETLSEVFEENEHNETKIDHAVMVIHGIRDSGRWASRLANEIRKIARRRNRTIPVFHESYGYLPFFNFLVPYLQRRSTEWFADKYCDMCGLYPDAHISFIGHSNGTLMLAESLRRYSKYFSFKNVVFVGSVVASDFNWPLIAGERRVRRLRNYVATGDIPVALLAKGFTWISRIMKGSRGAAGHDGFLKIRNRFPKENQNEFEIRSPLDLSSTSDENLENFCHVAGGHSAGLAERYWPEIASFIALDDSQAKIFISAGSSKSNFLIKIGGYCSGLIVASALLLLILFLLFWATPIFSLFINDRVDNLLKSVLELVGTDKIVKAAGFDWTGIKSIAVWQWSKIWSSFGAGLAVLIWSLLSALGWFVGRRL